MDRLLDSTTGDYTGDNTTTLANAVYLRLTIPLGSYWAAPNLGSKLYLLRREKDIPRVFKLAKQYAEEALKPLTESDDGRAKSINVTVTQGNPGWALLWVDVESADGVKTTFKHPVRVV